MIMYYFSEYTSKAEKTAKAQRHIKKLAKTIKNVMPVEAFNGKIAKTFWGQSWCTHLEKYADYGNRLERGRSYVRAGCVCHLEIQKGRILAKTSGTSIYTVIVDIQPLSDEVWKALCAECSGHTASVLELLQGKISHGIMQHVCHPSLGLFPTSAHIKFSCSCPDSAGMCKHIAATLYAVGRRFDTEPELLFVLRNVNPGDLVAQKLNFVDEDAHIADETLQDVELGQMFGIDIDLSDNAQAPIASSKEVEPVRVSSDNTANSPIEGKKSAKSEKVQGSKAKNETKAITFCGKDIAAFREKYSLPLSAFALLVGVSVSTVSRWEKSDTLNLSAKMYAKLYAVLTVSA